MNSNKNDQDKWTACPQGEIGQLAKQLKSRRHTQIVQRNAALLVLLIMVVSAGYFFVDNRSPSDPNFGGIACSEVQQHASEFVDKKLDPKMESKIQQHLAHCPACRERLEQLRLKKGRPAANGLHIEKNSLVAVAMAAKTDQLSAVSFSY